MCVYVCNRMYVPINIIKYCSTSLKRPFCTDFHPIPSALAGALGGSICGNVNVGPWDSTSGKLSEG